MKVYSKALQKEIQIDRIIGHLSGEAGGPTLVITGGIHGNEPSGVFALEAVIRELRESGWAFRGHFYAVSGNLWALGHSRRYDREDLNRLWLEDIIRKLRREEIPEADMHEDLREQKDILDLFSHIFSKEDAPYYFLDLHTTSSQSIPFLTINDTSLNRRFAQLFPLPVILGLEEFLEGPLLSYINELGHIAIGFEAGQHDAVSSIENQKAFIYLSLVRSGFLRDVPEAKIREWSDILGSQNHAYRHFYEIVDRYEIEPGESYETLPGFQNFQPVQKGQLLANSSKGPVRSSRQANIFMPLYQKQGNDGYFLVHEVPAYWLRLSLFFRRLHSDRLLVWLPGIRWYSPLRDILEVNLKVARFFAKEIFHLLGFRSRKISGGKLLLTNRERYARTEEYRDAPWYRS